MSVLKTVARAVGRSLTVVFDALSRVNTGSVGETTDIYHARVEASRKLENRYYHRR